MFGGGGMNPRKMKQMMKQMGIDVTELDATEVVIRTEGGEDLVFDAPQVTRMDAQGQQTYQIVGEPTRRDATAVPGEEAETADTEEEDTDDGGIPDSDVEIVAARAGVPESAAREALEAEDGDLAAAINRLE
ncbi:Transcription factor homologous to NACalpha-BTF3 [Halalkaliarchaeum sp. AArc-CO]|uniref:nascent polypeptide-associated complex protein n=1 Tax=Halalkaliarchaeum sp. AArc-CO TaxID=2866381 RepID=UPI00217DB50A|nr:nascent polypeptide-associated complex protein [Halalkaliarchaeum sp. AArc-CO]UWG50331.1 Transcription factor homologous to NACalpha-BTF3 [Halalkaliarchaeum sp. AArc-CO]